MSSFYLHGVALKRGDKFNSILLIFTNTQILTSLWQRKRVKVFVDILPSVKLKK
jgi:hypothetical protein